MLLLWESVMQTPGVRENPSAASLGCVQAPGKPKGEEEVGKRKKEIEEMTQRPVPTPLGDTGRMSCMAQRS